LTSGSYEVRAPVRVAAQGPTAGVAVEGEQLSKARLGASATSQSARGVGVGPSSSLDHLHLLLVVMLPCCGRKLVQAIHLR
jgi:hypothetical protein